MTIFQPARRDDVAGRVLHQANPVIERIARLGFAGKGLVAVVIGALALRLALGLGGELTGPKGALEQLLAQPFGGFVLAVVAIALWSHALWLLVEAFLDPERKGTGFTGIAERTAFGVTSIGYFALGMAAIRLLVDAPEAPSAGDLDTLVGRALVPYFGRSVVALIGAIVVVSGLLQLRLAIVAGFRHILELDRMRPLVRGTVIALGRAGYAGLGVLSCLVGSSLVRVAIEYDPDEADGWREALGFVASLGGESLWPLAALSAGLVCYGLYWISQVEYRRF